jgi:hypothetical protein
VRCRSLSRSIAALESDLRAEVQELLNAFDGKSERWRESDAGTEVCALDRVAWQPGADDLEAVTDEPQSRSDDTPRVNSEFARPTTRQLPQIVASEMLLQYPVGLPSV